MKKVTVILAVMLMSVTGFSQSVFDKFEDLDGVTSVILNQKMFKMLATMGMDMDDPKPRNMQKWQIILQDLRFSLLEMKKYPQI